LNIITSIKELELLKVALEMGNNDWSVKNSPQNRPQVRQKWQRSFCVS
jgi:hypothetical protein